MKKVLKLLVVLVVLVVVAGVVVVFYVDSIAKDMVEKSGTRAFGVDTTVGSADIRLLSGGVGLSEFEIANPDGFDTEHFFEMGAADMEVSIGSLRKKTVEVAYLDLEKIDINLERNGSLANFKTILKNLQSLPPDDDAKKFAFDRITIRDVVVHVDMFGGQEFSKLDVPIKEITLTDVGKGGKPISLAELGRVIVQAVLSTVSENAGDLIPADMLNDLRDELLALGDLDQLGIDLSSSPIENIEALQDQAKGLLKGLGGDNLPEGLEGAGDEIRNIGEGLGNLLGNDDDEG